MKTLVSEVFRHKHNLEHRVRLSRNVDKSLTYSCVECGTQLEGKLELVNRSKNFNYSLHQDHELDTSKDDVYDPVNSIIRAAMSTKDYYEE